MSTLRSTALASLAACLVAGPASAQITPEQVWAFWQGMATGAGYEMSASAQRREGASLVLEGVQASMLTDTAAMRAPLGRVVMRDRGDGTVEVTVEPSFEFSMTMTEPDSEPVEIGVTVEQDGYVVIVSGTPEAPAYAFTAESVTVGVAAPLVDGKEMPMDMTLTLGGLKGTTAMVAGSPMGLVYDLTAASMELAVSSEDPEGEGTFDLTMGAEALTARFDGTLPDVRTPDTQLAELLAAGFRGVGGYGTGPLELAFDVTNAGKSTSVSGAAEGSTVEFGLSPAGLSYKAGVLGLGLAVSGTDIPFEELTASIGEYTVGFGMPLTKSETASDFSLLMRLVDLALPEAVWGMLDPTKALPHDPATLIVDLKGKARLFHDLTSPEAQTGTAPGQVESVTIDAIQLKAAGADLTGTGAFTFDNADTETLPGMPRPTGSAEFTLVGGNTLLDRLVALGLVPQDQVMMYRMMMAMFARPGDGPDTMVSKIEVTPDWQILANGQRIQ